MTSPRRSSNSKPENPRSGGSLRDLELLGYEECVALLGTKRFGRLVLTESALPVVRPVNYVLYGQELVIRTSIDSTVSKLHGDVVAFEVDDIEEQNGSGWSVVVLSKARRVTDIETLVDLFAPEHAPWPSGDHPVLLTIPLANVTGRRLSSFVAGNGDHKRTRPSA